ncbi:hypothetical protein Syncc9605_1692 [Synechococcus sp. CC9605]|nr:hypothetical protein Syncc9605_1692 [Synechococcus sp. CC9605]
MNTWKSAARTHSSLHEKGGSHTASENIACPMNINRGQLSTGNQKIESMTEAAAARLASVPYYARPMPVPPEHDFLADVKEDRKLAAVMCAIARIANQRGKTFTQQVDIWEVGQ